MKTAKISKNQIIIAATQVISEKGLENINVDDIAKKAGIAKGSIYVYFKNRDEILTEAIKYLASEKIELLKSLIKKYNSGKDKISALVRANQFLAQNDPESFFTTYALILSTHKDIKTETSREFFKNYVNLIAQIIEEDMSLKDYDSKSLATIIVLASDIGNILSNLNSEDFNSTKITENLIKLIFK